MLARFAVRLMLAAERAVLAELEPVRVVAPVLPGDVVAVLALLTGQGDLGPDVGRSHGGVPFSCWVWASRVTGRTAAAKAAGPGVSPVFVAEAGLEPATQRL